MMFSVIYSIDCAKNVHIKQFYPRNMRPWQITEDDSGMSGGDYDDIFTRGSKHRKMCALLTKAQFLKFQNDCNIYSDDVETLGSLGAPGFGYGMAPAISFSADSFESSYGNDHEDFGYIQSAYVTPIPCYPDGNQIRKDGFTGRDWDRVRSVVIGMFR